MSKHQLLTLRPNLDKRRRRCLGVPDLSAARWGEGSGRVRQRTGKIRGETAPPPSRPSHFDVADFSKFVTEQRIDIRKSNELSECVNDIKPDFVFHLAAQALVRQSYNDPIATYQTNALGTLNLLEALRLLEKKCAVVLITSDKCYDNLEWVWGYRETDIEVEVLGRKHVDIRRQSLPSFQVEGLLFDIRSENQVVGVMPPYRIVGHAVQVKRHFADILLLWRVAVERRY